MQQQSKHVAVQGRVRIRSTLALELGIVAMSWSYSATLSVGIAFFFGPPMVARQLPNPEDSEDNTIIRAVTSSPAAGPFSLGDEVTYLSTAMATAFPPPRQSAAMPR